MPATLPARANLEYLKKQSKDLHRAFAEGEADAVDRIRRCLPRAGRLDESQLPGMDLSLQETQHALACEYGFGKWEELVAVVEAPGFEDLARLNDRETQILMREVDQNALVRALVGAAGPVVERFLQNMSERVRGFIETEIHSTGDLSAEEVAAARAGLVEQVRALPDWIVWPPRESAGPPSVAPAPADDPRLARIDRPLKSMSEQELVGVLQSLGERARDLGILSLEGCVRGGKWTLLTEGIRLTVDGTEPALVVDMLEIRAGTILRNRTIRGHMAIEGCMAIHAGDNPPIVAQKLTTYFVEEPELESPSREPTVNALIAVLRKTPVSRMSLAEFVDFFRDLAVLARQKSLTALAPLVAHVDDPVLAVGLGETASGDPSAQHLMSVMGQQLQEERVALHRRHCLVIKGIAGIQAGKKTDVLVAEAKQWAEEQALALASAPTPSPTTPL